MAKRAFWTSVAPLSARGWCTNVLDWTLYQQVFSIRDSNTNDSMKYVFKYGQILYIPIGLPIN